MEGTDRFGAVWQDKGHLPELPPERTTVTNLQGDDSGAISARLTFLRAPVTLPVSISALVHVWTGGWLGTKPICGADSRTTKAAHIAQLTVPSHKETVFATDNDTRTLCIP